MENLILGHLDPKYLEGDFFWKIRKILLVFPEKSSGQMDKQTNGQTNRKYLMGYSLWRSKK